jgi:hypothetical protein
MAHWGKTCTYLTPTLTLSQNEPKRDSTWPTSPWSSIRTVQNDLWACGTFSANHAAILPQDYHYLQIDWIQLRLEPRQLGVPLGASKMISEPKVRLAQIVHLSCTDTNTISKGTKTRFHVTYVTLEYHRVCPKWFQSLLYVHHKPCTYLASRLALSPNRLHWASTWASSPMNTIGCV